MPRQHTRAIREVIMTDRRRILVIDDNIDIHKDFERTFSPASSHHHASTVLAAAITAADPSALSSPGSLAVEVDFATQGEAGVEQAVQAAEQGQPYYMAFVDVRMPPGIDGIQTIKRLWECLPNLQCVICTAYSDYDWHEIINEVGLSPNLLILKKPFDSIEVLQMASALLEKWTLERKTRDLVISLRESHEQLKAEMDERKCAEAQRESLQSRLIEASRKVGKAEVATNVLHNAGNVLNSVNVSANLLTEKFQNSCLASLTKASDVISRQSDLATFLTVDERGKHFPRLLKELVINLADERDAQLEELRLLIDNIGHVKEIISMQQTFAQMRGITELVNLVGIVKDALKINEAGLTRHGVNAVCEFDEVPQIFTDKHRVLQILVNLISNAKYAVSYCHRGDKTVTLAVSSDDESVRIQVRDNGVGIAKDNLTKIFSHGFTTREEGHGFGLHSSALAAQELGGSLSAHSDGPGQGAIFTLRLPVEKEAACSI